MRLLSTLGTTFATLALMWSVPVHAGKNGKVQKLTAAHGTASIRFTPRAPEAVPSIIAHPRVGVAPSGDTTAFGPRVALALDDMGRVVAVAPSLLPATAQQLARGFDTLTRADFTEAVAGACRGARLDYVLVFGMPHQETKTDAPTDIAFVGSTHLRSKSEIRLYDCRSRKSVWASTVLFETSYGTFASAFNANSTRLVVGDVETPGVFAKAISKKLSGDMGW